MHAPGAAHYNKFVELLTLLLVIMSVDASGLVWTFFGSINWLLARASVRRHPNGSDPETPAAASPAIMRTPKAGQ